MAGWLLVLFKGNEIIVCSARRIKSMSSKFGTLWKEAVMTEVQVRIYYPSVCVEETKTTTSSVCGDSKSLG